MNIADRFATGQPYTMVLRNGTRLHGECSTRTHRYVDGPTDIYGNELPDASEEQILYGRRRGSCIYCKRTTARAPIERGKE